ncbi:hypothetical protein O6H91_05G070500 [Diphasiastrum complanatum]|uniref:Uncharacterized protein n=1 Tax=Diphasiastrum complanatum TaxID=34168 RepID=A0ACC2DP97_DIPCM|nr:hypothetical protein O6H91_Y292700 [Diphasiastrum complanatum]KAJ7556138.1 hypothetical protein O6H91_05G070500 [Diphasiastrum complanatum]
MADASAVTFSKDQGQIVKESWQILKPNMAETSIKFFLNIFEIAPAAIGMFSFLRDSSVPLEKNAKLKAHALIIFKLTCESAVQLSEQGSLVKLTPTLRKLGQSHHLLGVVDAHFEVVKSALLISLEEALQEHWSQKMKAAWAEAYDQLTSVMKDEIHAQAQLAAVKV